VRFHERGRQEISGAAGVDENRRWLSLDDAGDLEELGRWGALAGAVEFLSDVGSVVDRGGFRVDLFIVARQWSELSRDLLFY